MTTLDLIFIRFNKPPQKDDTSVIEHFNQLKFKTTEPTKRPSSFMAWVRYMQRFNKTIIPFGDLK